MKSRVGHFIATEEISLLECLSRHFGLNEDEGRRLLAFGAVYQDKQRVDSNRLLPPGAYIRVHPNPKRFPVEKIDWHAAVVYRNEEFVVVNKPAGIPVHATVDNQIENVLHQLRTVLRTPLFITQRLDVEVGGLIVYARTPQFQKRFNKFLIERRVHKRYFALTALAPPLGRQVHYMEPSERSPRVVGTEAKPGWQQCALRVESVRPLGHAFEVEIDLETGRTHQIRVQLAALGCPILGDTMYGSKLPYAARGIGLFSTAVLFPGPDRKAWHFELTPPWRDSVSPQS